MSLTDEERRRIEEEERVRVEARVRAEQNVRAEQEARAKLENQKKAKQGALGCLGVIVLLIIVIVIGSLSDSSKDSGPKDSGEAPAAQAAPRWSEGGTLHKATIGEWRKASPRNQLATSGDFVAAFMRSRGQKLASESDARARAFQLAGCISGTDGALLRGGSSVSDNWKVAEVAVLCDAFMEAERKGE